MPCCFAHRRLPSMIKPKCVGGDRVSCCMTVDYSPGGLDRHYFCFFGFGRRVQFGLHVLHQLVDDTFDALRFIFGNGLVVLCFLGSLERIMTNVTQCDAAIFNLLAELLGNLLTTLGSQWRHRDAHDAAIVTWVKT